MAHYIPPLPKSSLFLDLVALLKANRLEYRREFDYTYLLASAIHPNFVADLLLAIVWHE